MRPDPHLIPVPDGKFAGCWLAMLLVLSLACSGLGQEAAADAGSRQAEASAPGKAATTGPESRRPVSVAPALETLDLEALKQKAGSLVQSGLLRYLHTPSAERMSWGGLFALRRTGPDRALRASVSAPPRQDRPRRFHCPVPRSAA